MDCKREAIAFQRLEGRYRIVSTIRNDIHRRDKSLDRGDVEALWRDAVVRLMGNVGVASLGLSDPRAVEVDRHVSDPNVALAPIDHREGDDHP